MLSSRVSAAAPAAHVRGRGLLGGMVSPPGAEGRAARAAAGAGDRAVTPLALRHHRYPLSDKPFLQNAALHIGICVCKQYFLFRYFQTLKKQ